jgi:hypothetical protein
MGQMLREVSVQFNPAQPTYLRAIQSDQIVPTECVNKILQNFRIETCYIDTQAIHYLAIGRHVIWMLCDNKNCSHHRTITSGLPGYLDSSPSCESEPRECDTGTSTPIVGLHQIESELEQDIRGDADRLLERFVGHTERTDFDGYLGFACISKQAAINFPCDRLVDITDSKWLAVRWLVFQCDFKSPINLSYAWEHRTI